MKIIINSDNYNLQNDKRLLIPFVEVSKGSKSYLQKQGLINKDGSIVVEAKYDFVVGNCYSKQE